MMKTAKIFMFLSIICFCSKAQNKNVKDSLNQELTIAKDTSRVAILLDLADLEKFNQPKEALEHAKMALEESQILSFEKGKAKAYNTLGIINSIQNNYIIGLEYFMQSLKISESLDNQVDIANTLNNIANIYHLEKDTANALFYFQKALDIKFTLNDKRLEVMGLNSLGLAYTDYGMYSEAEECFHKMIDISKAEDKDQWLPQCYNQLGRNANLQGMFTEALTHYQEAVRWNKNLNRKKGEAIAVSNIGETYFNMKQFSKAIEYYDQSLAIREAIDYNYGIAITYYKLALAYQKIFQYEKSIQYAENSLDMANQLNLNEFKRDALLLLSSNYAKLNEYKKAYQNHKAFAIINDSMVNEEKIAQMEEMKIRFDTESKEKEIALQQVEIELLEERERASATFRYSLWTVATLLLLLVGFIYNRYRLKHRSEKMLQLKKNEVEAKNLEISLINKELEKRMLRAQMDPHFIFNSLNSIQHFITINDKDSALPYLSKFSKLIRQVLENSVNQQVPVADELKFLDYYLQLESLRFHHQFNYSIKIDNELDVQDNEIPFLLIQPYVENAIVHGIRHLDKPGLLNISLTKGNGYIECIIEDNGIGRAKSMAIKANGNNHVSHGIPITSKRLELLNRGRENKTMVFITDLYDENKRPNGTSVKIQIPLNSI